MGSATKFPADDVVDGQPASSERRALIERIAGSTQFRRSARLRDFLMYVGTKSLEDGSPDIHEQEIGANVFGRSESYDRSQDNIVRVNATELRKRIELYFATEGADEPLILNIPRGGYKPQFFWRAPEALPDTIPLPSHPQSYEQPIAVLKHESEVDRRIWLRLHLIWASISVGLLIACGILLRQNLLMRKTSSSAKNNSAVSQFWGDFLHAQNSTDLVLPDDSFSTIEDISRVPIPLGVYIDRGYLRDIQSSNLSEDRKLDVAEIFQHNLVTFGGVQAAQKILSAMPLSPSTHLAFARYYQADSLKSDNVILVGGRKANPWVHLFDDQLNFITDFRFDRENPHALVVNRQPKAGEQPTYFTGDDGNSMVGYSVLAYLPNPSHTGSAIILAGTDSDATDAAAEFLTSEEQLEKLRNKLHVQHFPYFEVLLKTTRLNGTLLRAEMITYRTH